jgi:hypothetical protein
LLLVLHLLLGELICHNLKQLSRHDRLYQITISSKVKGFNGISLGMNL